MGGSEGRGGRDCRGRRHNLGARGGSGRARGNWLLVDRGPIS